MARLAVGFAKLYARVVDKQVTQLLDSVGDSTSFLQELVASFTLAYFQQGHACQLAIFYETEKSNLLRKVLPLRYLADIPKKAQAGTYNPSRAPVSASGPRISNVILILFDFVSSSIAPRPASTSSQTQSPLNGIMF